MNRWLVIAAAAIVGVISAFFVFRTPDVGAPVADLDLPDLPAHDLRGGTPPVVAEPGTPDGAQVAEGAAGEAAAPPAWPKDELGREIKPPKPEAVAFEQRLKENDAMQINISAASWEGVKRALGEAGVPPSNPIYPDITALITSLNSARLSPDDADIPGLREREARVRQRIQSGGLSNEAVDQLFRRIDDARVTYPFEP